MIRFSLGLLALIGALYAVYEGGLWYLSQPGPPLEPGPVIDLEQGAIQAGIDRDDNTILQFNGIPFAAPPIGDLRWRAPAAAPGWEGVRDGRVFGPECMQARNGMADFIEELTKGLGLGPVKRHLARQIVRRAPPPIESEDCLYLNVRTHNVGGETAQPVMVWLHGGSHLSGAGSLEYYQTNALVRNNIVLVTINYRLGPFGYLAHPALSQDSPGGISGNYGLLDQIAALVWVKENIHHFGGDPGNVTIFGESAGAQSVTEIMASPFGNGLYHKAILQSGASTYNGNGLKTAIDGRMTMHEAGSAFLEGLVPADANAAELRAIPAPELIARSELMPELHGYFLPTVDEVVLPRLIGETIGDGSLYKVPILAGYNADEGTLFYDSIQRPTVLVPDFPETHAAKLAKLEEIYGPNGAKILISEYGLGDADSWAAGASDMLGDDLFGVHMRYLAKSLHAAGQPVWLYFFSRKPPSPTQTIGAFHAAELLIVFDSHGPLMALNEADIALTEAMGRYWTQFAHTSNPNGLGLPDWPAYDPASDIWLEFSPDIAPISHLRAARLDVLEQALIERVSAAVPQITPLRPAQSYAEATDP